MDSRASRPSAPRGSSLSTKPRSRSGSTDRPRLNHGSSLEGRPSTARTSMALTSGVHKPPDFRAEKIANVKELVAFLSDFGYCKEKLSPKTLQDCPPSKVFLEIFEFIMKFFAESFSTPQKPEEAIPIILKQLDYPFTISKSAIATIAPHTWPQLLHALIWLIKVIRQMMEFDCKPDPFEDYVAEAYGQMLNGHDNLADTEVKIRQSVMGEIESSMLPLKAELAKLDKELDDIHTKDKQLTAQIQELLDNKEKLRTQNINLCKFNSQADQYIETAQVKQQHAETELEVIQRKVAETLAHKEMLVCQLRFQDVTAEEYTAFRQRACQLETEHEKGEEDLKAVNAAIWTAEIKDTQEMAEIEKMCRTFNTSLISMADASVVEDLRLRPSATSAVEEQFNTVVEPYLNKVMSQITLSANLLEEQDRLRNINASTKQELEELREKLRLKSEKTGGDLAQLEAQFQAAKEKNSKLMLTAEQLEVEKIGLASESSILEAENERSTATIQAMCKASLEEFSRLDKNLRDSFEAVRDFIECCKRKSSENVEQMKLLLLRIQSLNRIVDQLDEVVTRHNAIADEP